jgi:polyhydroxybutyrate depolymerase
MRRRPLGRLLALLAAGCGSSPAPPETGAGDASSDDAPRGDSANPPFDAAADVRSDASTDVRSDTPSDTPMPPGTGSPGCGRAGMPVGYRNGVMVTSGGAARTYAISVPADYDPSRAYPLVFVFHGDGGTGAGIRTQLSVEAAAGTGGIFVYPDALAPARSFDLETPRASNPDIRFFRDALAAVRAQYCVDDRRVFAAGHSRGGFFANILNCRVGAPVLRAVAPCSGSIYSASPTGYTSDGHVACEEPAASALLVHGNPDPVVAFTDGVYARDQWTWANGCATTTRAYAPSPCVEYERCTSPARVVWCAVPGIGHGVWTMAGAAVWAFFDSFR